MGPLGMKKDNYNNPTVNIMKQQINVFKYCLIEATLIIL